MSVRMDASWIRRGGKMERDGGGVERGASRTLLPWREMVCEARRNACGAARSTDRPARHGGSGGWMARMGASWIRRGKRRIRGVERMRADGASRFGNLDLAKATEGSEMENSGSRVGACRSRKRPWTGLASGTPVRIVGMPGWTGLSNGSCFDWHGTGFSVTE